MESEKYILCLEAIDLQLKNVMTNITSNKQKRVRKENEQLGKRYTH